MSINTRPPKLRPWIDSTFIVVIIILSSLLALFLLVPTSAKQQESVVTASRLPEALEEITESNSIYPGIHIITEKSNKKKSPYFIQYPQTDNPSFNKVVTTYTHNLKTIYLEETKYIHKINNHNKTDLTISFEVFKHATEYYSFVVHNKMETAGLKDISETKIFRLHIESGHTLKLDDLLEKNEKSLEVLSDKVKKAITSYEKLHPSIPQVQLEDRTAPEWENFSNFALKEDSIDFYFNKGEITSDDTVISIPLSDINSILAPEFKRTLATPNTTEKTSTKKEVALTFDDGPNPKTTKKILDILKKYNAKATFFMIGSRVSSYPEIVKEMQIAGHELGNHSWSHHDLTKDSPDKIVLEINNTNKAIEKATGSQPTAFRPPYGAVNEIVHSQTSLPFFLWDVDTLDWKYRDANHLLEHVKKQVKDGSIVLMHDIHESTADGLDAVLAYLQGEGYTFVTVSELQK